MASAQEHGVVRFSLRDAAETRVSNPIDTHTATISGGALAPPTGAAFEAIPYSPAVNVAGSRLLMEFIAAATDIIESEESDAEIPVLYVDAKGKVVGRKTIKLEEMTGFKPSGTVDITATASIPVRVAYFDAPNGLAMTFDPAGKTRVYVGDDS